MKGENIHILEAMDIAGGACDGINDPTRGYVMRGGREMENHLNVCGICSEVFRLLRLREFLYLMNITGLTSMILIILFAGQL